MKELWQLFITFLKIGTLTFGGGYAMIPAIRRETVTKRGWTDEEGITDCIAVSQSLPGAFAVNVAIFIGKKIKGIPGAVAACFGLVFPAYLSILIILLFLGTVEDNVYIKGAFEGIKAASVALILVTTVQLGRGILKTKTAWVIAVISFVAIVLLSANAIYAILAGGLIGYFQYQYGKRKEVENR
ncbi:MAG: chromate transporter [Clostridiales bacterium]|nr:chromate transporter [Clostridiales bacterium]